ncbi:MAG: galactokinase [Spirochaetales bacterium]|jgi:galactokinase|nr:galactokinase [Spirochaetales bacterium]
MDDLIRSHLEEYGQDPNIIAQAPGRVNLIGEHTDYNEGFVLPMAIDYYVRVALSRRKDQHLRFFSSDLQDRKRTSLSNLRFKKEDRWANYPKGIISVLLNRGYDIGGLSFTVMGNVPIGVGLSSSAALEVATAYAVQKLLGIEISGPELARLAQEAENSFVGVQCGIMDQFVSRMAQAGSAMFIDTRNMEYRHIPINLLTVKILITNSSVPRSLVDSEYNQRRAECEKCVSLLSARKSGRSLRDYSAADLRDSMGLIPETTRKRCLHVVEENERVREAEGALKKNDIVSFGKLMNRSHESLRDQYEVSCPELDWLVKRAWETEGVYGSRMTGAGFGGCTVTLIEEEAIPKYEARLEAYEKIFSFKPETFLCHPADGARIVFQQDGS